MLAVVIAGISRGSDCRRRARWRNDWIGLSPSLTSSLSFPPFGKCGCLIHCRLSFAVLVFAALVNAIREVSIVNILK